MKMRDKIIKEIVSFVREYQLRKPVNTHFETPLVGFADAMCPEIQNLKKTVVISHELPQKILENPTIIISYYVPFTRRLALSNSMGEVASPQWARAYEELNSMFTELNEHLINFIKDLGYHCAIPKAASSFDRRQLVSNWSQRHIAYAAGLGTFGINNMLITKAGCCGRFSSVVTDLPLSFVPADKPMTEDLCLYKKNGSCGLCADKCPSGALNVNREHGIYSFSRSICYATCLKNAQLYPQGCFDDPSSGEALQSYSGSGGSEVCGKCVTGATCAFRSY